MAAARGSASRDRTVKRCIGRGPGATGPTLRRAPGRAGTLNEKFHVPVPVALGRDGRRTDEFPVTRLVLVRHGESVASVNRSIGGPRTCAGLSDHGRAQCDRLAARLAETGELDDVVLYASDYPRARETAEPDRRRARRAPRSSSTTAGASTTPVPTATG